VGGDRQHRLHHADRDRDIDPIVHTVEAVGLGPLAARARKRWRECRLHALQSYGTSHMSRGRRIFYAKEAPPSLDAKKAILAQRLCVAIEPRGGADARTRHL